MNAYRQLAGNNAALAKNIERLSSGFRINRAADDAAGLAISEKMRAQIRGLESAQKNANDGISLIQTAEGALAEVHDMLNRMVDLATQAANGIYDDTVDRAALDNEFQQLKDEIDRISKSTNFNGTNLLDGSLGGAGGIAGGGAFRIGSDISSIFRLGQTPPVAAVAAEYTFNVGAGATHYLQNILGITDDLDEIATDTNGGLVLENLIRESLGDLAKDYDVTVVTGANGFDPDETSGHANVTITARTAGVDQNRDAFLVKERSTFYESVTGVDTYRDVRITLDLEAIGDTGLIGKTITLNGKTYQFTGQADEDEMDLLLSAGSNAKLGGHITKEGFYSVYIGDASEGSKANYAEDVVRALANVVNAVEAKYAGITAVAGGSLFDTTTGTGNVDSFKVTTTADLNGLTTAPTSDALTLLNSGAYAAWSGTQIRFFSANLGTTANVKGGASGSGINFQIGDTADSYNRLTFNIEDMSTKGLGIDKASIATIEGAARAMGTSAQQSDQSAGTIKSAINLVSAQRASLGAIQNRLDHTINNLSVTIENITQAESRIRDADMAKEMMAYTKNNILVQAAQSMLAHANQIPQSILRLLGN